MFNPQLEPGVSRYVDDVDFARVTGANFGLLDVEFVRDTRNNPAEVLLCLSNANPDVRTEDGLPADSNQLYAGWGVSSSAEIRFTDLLQLASITAYREVHNYFVNKFDLVGAGAGFITGALGAPREWSLTMKKEF